MTVDPVDPLEPLRCPKNGCDTRFLVYLTWEDTELRIIDERTVWRRKVGRNVSVYTLGLRCANCGYRWSAKKVEEDTKVALDDHLASVSHLLQDLVDEQDDERLRVALLGETATIMEEKPGES